MTNPSLPLRCLAAFTLSAWTAAAASNTRLTVDAGTLDRRESVVSFQMPAAGSGSWELREESGRVVPVQIDAQLRGWFVLDELKAGGQRGYQLAPAGKPAPGTIAARKDGAVLRLTVAGQPAMNYQTTPSEVPSPEVAAHYRHGAYLHPVFTPAGRLLTADYPPDHRHQRGIFFAWTLIDFEGRKPDFWNMGKDKSGTIGAAVEFESLDRHWGGAVHGGFESRHRFMDFLGGTPKLMLREAWNVRLFSAKALGGRAWLLDLESTQECGTASPVKLPKYHYGGLGVRGQAGWDPEKVPQFITSNGDDRKKGDASKANWVHLGGPVDDAWAGIAVFGHPDNFRSPQALRLNPKNPQLSVVPSADGDWEIVPGKPYVSRYRFVLADGKPDSAELEKLWQDYAHPPRVKVSSR